MEKQWVTVAEYKGFAIKVLNNAEVSDDFGYKVDSWVLWANSYETVHDAMKAIDELINDEGVKF